MLNYIYPPVSDPELEKVLIGRDLLEVSGWGTGIVCVWHVPCGVSNCPYMHAVCMEMTGRTCSRGCAHDDVRRTPRAVRRTQVPMYREDTLYQIRARDQRLMLGPYALLEGFQGMCECAGFMAGLERLPAHGASKLVLTCRIHMLYRIVALCSHGACDPTKRPCLTHVPLLPAATRCSRDLPHLPARTELHL